MDHPFVRPLLATEHTDSDAGAEAVALALARACGLPLAVVMPVVSNPEYEAIAPEVAARADARVSDRRAAFVAEAGAAGVALELQVRHGPQPWQEIVAQARALGSDLLVIRRRGHAGRLAELLIGDMVGKVLAHAPCPVLVCPRDARMWRRGVLAALAPDGRDAPVQRAAAAVARRCGLPLSEASIASGPPHRGIVEAAVAAGADLIVVGRHRGDFLGRAWIGGTAQKVIGLAGHPVLVIPPNPEPAVP